ncbi:hypothetical protein EC518_13390 [Helicobacter pylori]|uniref:Uncharacterized protein n=1 Tax=Helicobacter pylori TaxID=210 RepID=A0A438W5W4_HELPX|nr:hypothetical protein EC518_13390 [Helicobacter pylori]
MKDRNQVEQDLQQSNIQDGFSQDNTPNAPDFDRLQALNAINNDGEIKDKSQVEKNLVDGENIPKIYSSLDTYA